MCIIYPSSLFCSFYHLIWGVCVCEWVLHACEYMIMCNQVNQCAHVGNPEQDVRCLPRLFPTIALRQKDKSWCSSKTLCLSPGSCRTLSCSLVQSYSFSYMPSTEVSIPRTPTCTDWKQKRKKCHQQDSTGWTSWNRHGSCRQYPYFEIVLLLSFRSTWI